MSATVLLQKRVAETVQSRPSFVRYSNNIPSVFSIKKLYRFILESSRKGLVGKGEGKGGG